ncbi:MAG: hypothetical protein ACK45B_08985 [Limisphaerales bacterium]
MDADERAICDYLKSWPKQFVAAREIARRAGGKRRFREEPQWAYPVIARLLEDGIIETDGLGHYRLCRRDEQKQNKGRWLSPQMRRILERSEKDFSEVLQTPDHHDLGETETDATAANPK